MLIHPDFSHVKGNAVRVRFQFLTSQGVSYVNADRKASDVMDDARAAAKKAARRVGDEELTLRAILAPDR